MDQLFGLQHRRTDPMIPRNQRSLAEGKSKSGAEGITHAVKHRLTLTLATLGYAALLAKNSRST